MSKRPYIGTRKSRMTKKMNSRLKYVNITRPWLITFQSWININGVRKAARSLHPRSGQVNLIKFESRQPTGWCGWCYEKWQWVVGSRMHHPPRKGYTVKKRAKFWLEDKLKRINK